MLNQNDFLNKYVLVTGASKGLGASIALEFAKRGANIILHYNSDLKGVKEVASKIKSLKVNSYLIKANLSNENERVVLASEVKKITKKIDVLVNNAGFYVEKDGLDIPSAELDKYFAVHVTAIVRLSSLLKSLMNSKSSIINISSKNAIAPKNYVLGYSASKAAVNSITISMAQSFAPIRVNAVSPGPIMTPMWKGDDKSDLEKAKNATLLKRFGTPEEIAKVVAFIASEDASFMTGSNVLVDGGALSKRNLF